MSPTSEKLNKGFPKFWSKDDFVALNLTPIRPYVDYNRNLHHANPCI